MQIWTMPYKYIHKNLDSVAKADATQVWLYIHTDEEITLELCEVFRNMSFVLLSTAEWKQGSWRKDGEEEASDLYSHHQVKIFTISLLHRTMRGPQK